MAPETSAEANRYRIARLEQDVHDLQRKLDTYAALEQKVVTVTHDCGKLEDDFASLRRAFYTAALTVGGSAILFAVSVLSARIG